MVGGHTTNKALKESGREFTANFKSKPKSDMRNKRINRNKKIRPATGKMLLATVPKKNSRSTTETGWRSNI